MAKIMVVDDEPNIVKVVSLILNKEGHECIPAYNGEEALKKLETEKPDLITLDIMMPGIDGFETLKRIREKKETSTIPVVIISAKVNESDIVKGLELGANDYFTKPYNKTILMAKVMSILKFKQMEDQIREYSEELEKKVEERTQELKEAHEKLKTQYYLLEKDLDMANIQMEHDQERISFIAGLLAIFTGVLLLSLIILISTWNIDYLIALFGTGGILTAIHIRKSQKKMTNTTKKIDEIREKRPQL